MSPWYVPSLLPIPIVAAVLAGLAWRRERPGLASWCAALGAWAISLVLSARDDTRALGSALLMVGFWIPAGLTHAVAEDLGWKTPAVRILYAGAALMIVLGAIPPGLFLREGGTMPGPLWLPMFAAAGLASLFPVVRLARAQREAPAGARERIRYLLLAALLSTFGGGLNVLLTMTGRQYPAGLYMVLLSLALLAWLVQTQQLPEFGRFVTFSLRFSLLAALLSALYLSLVLFVIQPDAVSTRSSWGAGFLLFLTVLIGQPLLAMARGQLATSLFPGQGDLGGIARALAESEARAEHAERLAELGALSSAVAHEVRNPLGVITACTTVLERQGADPETLKEIRDQVERAATFAEDLLHYGRPQPLRLRPVDLAGAAVMAVDEVRRALPWERFPECTVSGEATVEGDLSQLLRLIGTLIENAALAGASTVEIRIEPGARVTVSDDGPGVPAEIAERLFEPFVSGRGREALRPGTGLGLAIARGVAERHHGELTQTTSPLGGAAFALRIPEHPPLPAGG